MYNVNVYFGRYRWYEKIHFRKLLTLEPKERYQLYFFPFQPLFEDANYKKPKKWKKKLEYQLPDRSSRKNAGRTIDTITNEIETTTTTTSLSGEVHSGSKEDDGLVYIQYQEDNTER